MTYLRRKAKAQWPDVIKLSNKNSSIYKTEEQASMAQRNADG
jgi:hypothetical protein